MPKKIVMCKKPPRVGDYIIWRHIYGDKKLRILETQPGWRGRTDFKLGRGGTWYFWDPDLAAMRKIVEVEK